MNATPVELGHRTINTMKEAIISRVSHRGKSVGLATRHALNFSIVVIDVVTGRQHESIVTVWTVLE